MVIKQRLTITCGHDLHKLSLGMETIRDYWLVNFEPRNSAGIDQRNCVFVYVIFTVHFLDYIESCSDKCTLFIICYLIQFIVQHVSNHVTVHLQGLNYLLGLQQLSTYGTH
jgi:hypothetical protein